MITEQKTYNFFTVDVEDWFNSTNLNIPISHWDNYDIRIINPIRKILNLLKKYKTKATFFVLGYIANRVPDLIKEIQDQGHEIASHGYYHQKITIQTKDEFRIDIEKSLEILSKITENNIIGYRAPSFTITDKTLWAIDILKEFNFDYDSSLYPVKFHPDYGIKNIDSKPFIHQNGLVEFPLSSLKILNNFVPFSGGAYFRFYPYSLSKSLITKFIKSGNPFCFYIHPWELDSFQPKAEVSFIKNFRHRFNISKNEYKLENLFRDFHFTNLGSYWEKFYGV